MGVSQGLDREFLLKIVSWGWMGGLLIRNGRILPGYPKIQIFEYAAFDLYRAMAQQSEHSETREAFLAIAQAEKGHMRALARSIEKCH